MRFKIKNKVEIAKVGTWNDFEMTEAVLKEAVENSDNRIPIRRGHTTIKPGEPSEGYLSNLRFNGSAIVADQILFDDLAKEWQEEKFINRSIDLSQRGNKYYVSAMALLGAEAPGVKGLKTFKEDNIIRFTDKIKNEVNMDFEKEIALVESKLQKSFDEKLNKVKLEFTESEKDKDKIISDLQAENAKLKEEKEEQKKMVFAEMAEEKVKDILKEDERKLKKEKLLKFSEKCDTVEEYKEYLSEINFKSTKAVVPETKLEFSEESEEFNPYKKDLKCYGGK